jgi:hypothetical protein
MTKEEIQALLDEAGCLSCYTGGDLSDLIKLALLTRISEGTAGGTDTQVQFNDGGVLGGDSAFTWNKTTNLLSITGGIALTGEANETPLAISGYSLTGANAQSALSIAGTWNTTGTPTAINLQITDTASNADSLMIKLGLGASSIFEVSKSGIGHFLGGIVIGNVSAVFGAVGQFTMWSSAIQRIAMVPTVGIYLQNAIGIRWSSTNSSQGVIDTGIYRNSAGVAEINNGTAGTLRDLWAQTLRTATAFTVGGTLPAAGVAGRRAYVTNANASFTAGIGAVVAAGGANVVPVFDDGVNWRIG